MKDETSKEMFLLREEQAKFVDDLKRDCELQKAEIAALKAKLEERDAEIKRILGDYADLCEVGLAAKLTKSRDAFKAIAVRLAEALRRFSIDCGLMHHRKGEFHKASEDCPVVEKVNQALAAYSDLLKGAPRE